MQKTFESQTFSKRLKSMLKVDARRMFTTPFFYIMTGICLVMPVLILVMTTMMDGMTTINQQTGVQTTIEGFDNVWQIIGTVSGSSSNMDMSLTSMCNINMLYFFVAVLVCVFVSDDFRSGYAKNLFTVRSKKDDYVISKALVCFLGGACMFLAFFIGSLIGGGIASLPFTFSSFNAGNLIACMLAKIFLISIFVSIFLLASVVAKQKLWLSILLSLGIGMLFFTMIPMTPLDSGVMNVVLSLVGGALFSVGIGFGSKAVLDKTNIV